ncbi:MAG: carbon starvation CstA family protein [Planctomycetota bacterium]
MNAVWPTLACFAVYLWGYRVWGRRLSDRVFGLRDDEVTPAHTLRNDVDYLPTNRFVLFGHHFASITGLSPMLGPAIAVIWGWAPAMIWVVVGAVLVGCVHDFAALAVSIRARGQSIGKVAEAVVGRRAKGLFLAIIFFGVSLAMGVFTIVIASLFAGSQGSAVIPSGGLMVVAAVMGWLAFRRGVALMPLTVVGFAIQLGLVWVGHRYPVGWADPAGWKWLLLAYAAAASVLPVWSLLQPRDFLNSLLLYLGIGMCFVGFFVEAPRFAAPAFDPSPAGAPNFYPFVFITIACGAASGFHSLVSSGTTAKQLDRARDARLVGYGGMIGESLLGLLAVLATTAGVVISPAAAAQGKSAEGVWRDHYATWHAASGLGPKMERFIEGAAGFVGALGFDPGLAAALIGVIVISFALTTLDSATRLLRYNVEEIGASLRVGALQNRFVATGLAVASIGFFAFNDAAAGLWKVFGTVNQLLAGLALLVATLYLVRRGRNPWVTGIPTGFMLLTALVATLGNLESFSHGWTFAPRELRPGEATPMPWLLFVVAVAVGVLGVWLTVEAALAFRRFRREARAPEALEVRFED